jgi:hypothetical protein
MARKKVNEKINIEKDIEPINNLSRVEDKIEQKVEEVMEEKERKKDASEEFPQFEIGFDPFQDQTSK